jgi:hypothetical protein
MRGAMDPKLCAGSESETLKSGDWKGEEGKSVVAPFQVYATH